MLGYGKGKVMVRYRYVNSYNTKNGITTNKCSHPTKVIESKYLKIHIMQCI